MKRSHAITAMLAAALAVPGMAQAAATEGTQKIAVIAFQQAVAATNEFRRDYADVQKKYEPKREALKTLNDQVVALKNELQTKGATMTDGDRATRTRTLDEKTKQLQRDQDDDQNAYQQDMQDVFNRIAGKVVDVTSDYAKLKGFTLVLDGSSDQTQLVLYANPATDITRDVIAAYNDKSGVPAPPASAGAAAAPAAPAAHPPAHAPATHTTPPSSH